MVGTGCSPEQASVGANNNATTGGLIAQGASGEPAEATQLAAEAITGKNMPTSILRCRQSLTASHIAFVNNLGVM